MARTDTARQRQGTSGEHPRRSPAPVAPDLDAMPTPRQIVEHLDRYIVGQENAKRAVAIALRNRYRRRLVPEEARNEIRPANILMIGPTGVGKTEIARRVAQMIDAPFVKVEATRFTEVGFVGKDVESIIRDLVEVAVSTRYRERIDAVREQSVEQARERLLDVLAERALAKRNPAGTHNGPIEEAEWKKLEQAERRAWNRERKRWATRLDRGEAESEEVELELDDGPRDRAVDVGNGAPDDEMQQALVEMLDEMFARPRTRRRMTVESARRQLESEEADRLIDFDTVIDGALQAVESTGVVFIDELDKTIATDDASGADISAGGVQRDLLPLLEGAVVQTRYGPVRTDHILFIASGAFHGVRPSDLIPELQGRFPVRVELDSLSEADLHVILSMPEYSLVWQYRMLLQTEGVELSFTPEAMERIAHLAAESNAREDDIGARRLQSLMERLLEDVLFGSPEGKETTVSITAERVDERIGDIIDDEDLALFIL